MRHFLITFGLGSPLAKYYVDVEAETEYDARCKMMAMFSAHWANIYPESHRVVLELRHGLTPLNYNLDRCSVRLGTNPDPLPLDVYQTAFGLVGGQS